ncbi:PREDICTED: cystatin-11 [Chrysochloris asiatica]|uniref:Cystatin-11 n=1 Tax=Chrysochloris asiatica TaxID=185453 RepID=A0A9B0TG57_CHRAS|nr:PREDICTED: cystatin-11 [Chrysochloris asiatica]
MARTWQALLLLLAMLLALVALTNQAGKKTFISISEVSKAESHVKNTVQFMMDTFNQENEDPYNFRIIRILNIQKQVSDHMEYHINVEMRRTTCQKLQVNTNCGFQEGELYKQIKCYFSVFVIPWFEKFKVLKRNCTND